MTGLPAPVSRGEHLADGGIASNHVYYPSRDAIDKINSDWAELLSEES